MANIVLREYQDKGFRDAMNALLELVKRFIVLECPTGGGKTVIFSYIVQRAESKGSKTLILTDRDELLRGTGGTLEDFGVSPGYIKSGRKFAPGFKENKTFVAMAQTLRKRLDKPDWLAWLAEINLVIIDECHKQEFNNFFEQDIFEGKTVIGFSATPKRGGKMRQLGDDYEDIIHTLTVTELIDLGFLKPDMYYGFKDMAPDLKGVKKNSRGDYSESDMFKKYDTPKLYGGLVEAWKQHTPNTITLVFGTNIVHCVRTCKEFCKAGIPAKFLSSKMSKPVRPEGEEPIEKKEASSEWVKYWEKCAYYIEYAEAMAEYSGPRQQLIDDWKAGEFKVMINAGILTTGFDFPAIETVALFRATVSEVLYLQMLGRGSRPSDQTGKTHFNILDFGRNAERLGGYKLPRKWHLFHETKAGQGVPPVKECGEAGKDKNGKLGCHDYILASAKICPTCGYIYPQKKTAEEAKLELMYTDVNGKLRSVKPLHLMEYAELELFAEANRYKKQWVTIQIYIRGGLDELKKYAKFKNYSPGWVTQIYSRIPASVKSENNILQQQAV